MEKIIATEVPPNGLDNEVLTYLLDNSNRFSLDDSVVYYGFPVFKDYEDSSFKSNFLILSKNYGLILLQTSSGRTIDDDDENLSHVFSYLEAAIKKSKILRVGKKSLALPIESCLFCAGLARVDDLENELVGSIEGFEEFFEGVLLGAGEELSSEILDEARSIIEGSKALSKPSKRTKISDDPSTKLNILIELEKEISNFDIEQRKIAISLINGPQRIRGLAGSGKTVVLAMKAAHIHLQHPNRKILFTFFTKSLYVLIKELIARFHRHFAGDEPNWEYIDVLHAWGGSQIDGVYFNACVENSHATIPFATAKSKDPSDPFSYVCADIVLKSIDAKYHHILIDEAQDLPNDFFKICYKLAIGGGGEEKNIVWAYDDLQSIFNVYQRTSEQLFGCDEMGVAHVDLNKFKESLTFGQNNDLVLYRCYRNPLEVLVTAHALGFGLYSDKPVQMLENEEHWEDVGYTLTGGTLEVGAEVVITRNRENSPLSIQRYQSSQELIQYFRASTIEEECAWILDNICQAIEEGLKPHDILVISLDDMNARNYFLRISRGLSEFGIRSNNLLISRSAAPPFQLDEMVTLSTVHRAKGNEASMVLAVGIDALYPFRKMRSGRNKLFTAFTRTKAWLRVSGIGARADYFFNELQQSIENAPSLRFVVPSLEEIDTIQRDLNGKNPELLRLQTMMSDLRAQGYSESEIQLELSLVFGKEE
ncbi:ATP-binding domain-containing protein [Pseudomonas piscis]|uniref:DNA 3'-5' helicase II n=1 Tax=Pseudomonas piscis TaxID=2614538 RepID=A0ABY9NAB9_9PSED|nr:ATP-binding domain-containing protein [Pseudomonas piscis]WMN15455.1 ATP-binding domain-containing protein [Pseudomonas piscis]